MKPFHIPVVLIFLALGASKVSAQYTPIQANGKNDIDSTIIYKSKIVYVYSASDSTMHNKSVIEKRTYHYTTNGKLLDYVREDTDGRITERSNYRYNEQDNPVGGATYNYFSGSQQLYDSTSYVYDKQGRCILYTFITRNYKWNSYDDTGRLDFYIKSSKYTENGHIEISDDDSANIVRSIDSSFFDNKNREICARRYYRNKLTEVDSDIYKSDGTRIEIEITYGESAVEPNDLSVIADKRTWIYDKGGKNIFYLEIEDDTDGATITQTTSNYNYKKNKLMSHIEITKVHGKGKPEKYVTKEKYMYDKNGYITQSTYSDDGGKSLTKYKYNGKNKEVEQVEYIKGTKGTFSKDRFIYFPNDTVVKEAQYYRFRIYNQDCNHIIRYNDRGDVVEEIGYFIGGHARENVYTYEYWK